MTHFFRTFIRIIKSISRKASTGDISALKLALFVESEETNSFTSPISKQKELHFTPIDFKPLAQLPAGTLGRVYSDFMKENQLSPLNFTNEVHDIFDKFPIGMRYIRIHDLVHVLLGFKTDIAGEIGVYAFIAEQSYSKTLNSAARTAKIFGRILFWKRAEILSAEQRGFELAQGAKPLILIPLEERMNWPLEKVRAEAGLKIKE